MSTPLDVIRPRVFPRDAAYVVVQCGRCGTLMALEPDAPPDDSTLANTCSCRPPRRFVLRWEIVEVTK